MPTLQPSLRFCGGLKTHPTAFLHFSGSLKPFTHKPCGLFGGLETHPTTKPCGFAVGWEAHPISTCGAFGGLKTHPTAFLLFFRQPETLFFTKKRRTIVRRLSSKNKQLLRIESAFFAF
ncbi:MAG: hypothetical protein IKZ88_02505 [Neisseriaceae bacterium]|nr:hypothetical protein [Neisseriaceae bacterium]